MFRSTAIVFIFCLIGMLAQAQEAEGKRKTKAISVIVIDPGHGGTNLGALGITGVYEKDVNLAISLKLKEMLEHRSDIKVILTRESDIDVGLEERIAIANQARADLFLSIHCNASFNTNANGVETLILSEEALKEETDKLSSRSVKAAGRVEDIPDETVAAVVKDLFQYSAHRNAKPFAEHLTQRLVRRTGSINRGIKELAIVVLRGAEMPGVVVELGFLTHPVEGRRLVTTKFQHNVAGSLYWSIMDEDDRRAKLRGPEKMVSSK